MPCFSVRHLLNISTFPQMMPCNWCDIWLLLSPPTGEKMGYDTDQPAPAARAAQGGSTAPETLQNETDLGKTRPDRDRTLRSSRNRHGEFARLFLDIAIGLIQTRPQLASRIGSWIFG